jgi:hypothetical protein
VMLSTRFLNPVGADRTSRLKFTRCDCKNLGSLAVLNLFHDFFCLFLLL